RYGPSLQRRHGRDAGHRLEGAAAGRRGEAAGRTGARCDRQAGRRRRDGVARRVRPVFRGGRIGRPGQETKVAETSDEDRMGATQATAAPAGRATPMDKLWAGNDDDRATGEPALVVDVDGFEGPLDLLLHLARNQKVDLARISIVALAEQYLASIARVRAMRLELAADYLVMAAWLAFLKSKLLIPKQKGEEGESGEEMAAVLQFR